MKTITPIRSREYVLQNTTRHSPNTIIQPLKIPINLQFSQKKRFASVKLTPYLSDFCKTKDLKQLLHNQYRQIKKTLSKQSSSKRFRIQQFRFDSTKKIISKDSLDSDRSFKHFYNPNSLQHSNIQFKQYLSSHPQFSSQLYQKLKPKHIRQNKFHQNKFFQTSLDNKTTISLKKIKQKTIFPKSKSFRKNKFHNSSNTTQLISNNLEQQQQQQKLFDQQITEDILSQVRIKMKEQIEKELIEKTKEYFMNTKKGIRSNNEIQQYLSTALIPCRKIQKQQKQQQIKGNKKQQIIGLKSLDYNFDIQQQINNRNGTSIIQQQSNTTTQNNTFSSSIELSQQHTNNNIFQYNIPL